jgi:anti-sigma factor RsiW
MMTCRDVVEFLMNFLDGELPEQERARFEEHLCCCPPCVNYLKTYEEAIKLEKGCLCGPNSPLPPIPEELVRAILAARGKC